MNINNDYDDDYYESSDYDIIHFDEEYDEVTGAKPIHNSDTNKKKSRKQKRLEDWLEEKRLRDDLSDENLDPP